MYFGVTFISSFDIFFVSAIYQQNDTLKLTKMRDRLPSLKELVL